MPELPYTHPVFVIDRFVRAQAPRQGFVRACSSALGCPRRRPELISGAPLQQVDLCFICDCFINMNLIYYDDEEQRFVVDRLAIFLHYLRGTMLIDFASSIPIEVIVSATQGSGPSQLGSLRALRVLRLTKLLRILRSNKIMRRLEDHYHIHYSCAHARAAAAPPAAARLAPSGQPPNLGPPL